MPEYTAAVIASWPRPNYIDPQTRGDALYYINSTFLFLATVAVSLRLYTRIWIRNWFGLDDAFILVSLIAIGGITACVILGYHSYGWDRHIYDIPLTVVTPSGKTLYASRLIWAFASSSVRASIMCLYYRLLKHCDLERFRWILHTNLGFIVIVLCVQLFTSAFGCWPVEALWTWPPIEHAHCLNNDAAMLAGASLNTISEFFLAALPIPAVFYLRIKGRQRWAVISILSMGFLVVLVGCVRVYYIWKGIHTIDVAWWAGPHWICSELEIDTALICSCIPVLRPMIGRLLTRGPGAAKRPALNESGRSRSQMSHRSESLFTKWSNLTTKNFNNTHNSNPTQTSSHDTQTSEIIDLEGIANDGFGYTVHISAGHAKDSRAKRKWRLSSKQESQGDISPRRKSRIGIPRWLLSRNRPDTDSERTIGNQGIGAETTYDVRESYHESNINTWDVRNPYTSNMSADDIEKSMERAARLGDWSVLDDRDQDGLPSVQEHGAYAVKPPQTSYMPGHRRAGLSQRPMTSGDPKVRPSTAPTMPRGILKNYNTSDRYGAAPSISSSTNSFITRRASPVQPLNSSQMWATGSPHRPISPLSVQTNTGRSGITAYTRHSGVSGSWSMALDTVYTSPVEPDWPNMRRSSVAGRDGSVANGSEESLVIGEDSEMEPPGTPGTPQSLKLPIQR